MAALSQKSADENGLAVSLRAVTKTFDNGVTALGPLDLDIGKGAFVSPWAEAAYVLRSPKKKPRSASQF